MAERVVRATGGAEIRRNGDELTIYPRDGLVIVTTVGGGWSKTFAWHPIGGWFDPMKGVEDGRGDSGGDNPHTVG